MNGKILFYKSLLLRFGSLAFAIGVFCILSGSLNIHAQATDREAMDELLKKELKGDVPKTDNSEKSEKKIPEAGKETGAQPTAANPVEERYKPVSDGPGLGGILFRIVLVLGILCGGVYWILKTIAASRDAKLPVRGEMNLLSSLLLGPNKQLQIVEVTGQIFVLGVADSGINLISEITDPETKSRLQRMKDEYEPPEGGFLVSVLAQLKDLNTKISGTSRTEETLLKPQPGERKEKQKKLKQKLDEIKRERNNLENGLFDVN
ncbi:flagellar biosynthesis protein FliO domain protein [Leptospira fainei serovar Hurstbridge str. BUT 6]|uniref:Flagellar biosynthesis protein FliO domain protein n=1 Tax=Leptospira fainei serovar Hurstbridge str. BUT 6 TaxID=1193011 RepID=S3VGX8_9LEPT|nr:flagellar biosynthetic protein FliO [Leptospira fainei]EPG75740.1 flagellar biosynthesis protein FliO domain protein [Leptospira fainei serovar Hurstbridge str. BUT 6]